MKTRLSRHLAQVAASVLLALSVFAASCSAPRPALTTADSREIVATVTAGMKSYAAALGSVQADRIAAHYVEGPEFRLTSDGVVYSRAALQEVLAGAAAKLSKMEVTWESITVTPLGPEAALAVAPFRRADFAKDGTVSRNRGVATWVWVRRAGHWRMLYGHGDHHPDAPAANDNR